jgi:hypothetical protein
MASKRLFKGNKYMLTTTNLATFLSTQKKCVNYTVIPVKLIVWIRNTYSEGDQAKKNRIRTQNAGSKILYG